MFAFEESGLRLSFDRNWRVLKWDQHPAFIEGLQRHRHTGGVDFLALHGTAPYFIEIKSFREHRIENKGKFRTGELVDKIAGKVRDTIAGAVWAVHRGLADGEVTPILRHLFVRPEKFRVVFWLEEDPWPRPADRSVLQAKIKERLNWLSPHVLVSCKKDPGPIPGLTVYGV